MKLRPKAKIRKALDDSGARFLEHALGAIERILPHMGARNWSFAEVKSKKLPTKKGCSPKSERPVVAYTDSDRRTLKLQLSLLLKGRTFTIGANVERHKAPSGIGSILRTVSTEEKEICTCICSLLKATLGRGDELRSRSLDTLRDAFDQLVVATVLGNLTKRRTDFNVLLNALRRLSEQSYENKAIAFGLLITKNKPAKNNAPGARFPDDFLSMKRFRALSDGYQTAYVVDESGRLIEFLGLPRTPKKESWVPDWASGMATVAEKRDALGIALTRHGDILVMHKGAMTFTYRRGQWHYWQHSHLVDLMHNATRAQKTPATLKKKVAKRLFQIALDISFRRTGGLLVLMKNKAKVTRLVSGPDRMWDAKRGAPDAAMDWCLGDGSIQDTHRSVLADIVSLDGALVVGNRGQVLSYAAIIEPARRTRSRASEGSRTRAAIAASRYGMAVKVSSDGDITAYVNKGKELFSI
jgi:hypothetical protein